MTMMSSSAMQPAIPAAPGGFVRRIGTWTHALAIYLERRSAIKTLRELDDRALRDIGIVRSQIEDAVTGATHLELGRWR